MLLAISDNKIFMRGFTLVELVIVIAIAIILAVISAPIYGSLQMRAQLGESTAQLVQTLRNTRELAVAGQNSAAHGVYLDFNDQDFDSYIAYQGSSYITRNANFDQVFKLEKTLSFANINLKMAAGDVDVNFSKGLGQPSNSGSFQLIHNSQGIKTISIGSKGLVEEK